MNVREREAVREENARNWRARDRTSCSNGASGIYESSVPMDFFFFFQAEDGIRDGTVTGVQTCALPICRSTAFFKQCQRPAEALLRLRRAALIQERAAKHILRVAARDRRGAAFRRQCQRPDRKSVV